MRMIYGGKVKVRRGRSFALFRRFFEGAKELSSNFRCRDRSNRQVVNISTALDDLKSLWLQWKCIVLRTRFNVPWISKRESSGDISAERLFKALGILFFYPRDIAERVANETGRLAASQGRSDDRTSITQVPKASVQSITEVHLTFQSEWKWLIAWPTC